MSCPNFKFMEHDLPLIVAEPAIETNGYDNTKEEYEEVNDEEYTEGMYLADIELDYDFLAEDMEERAKEINDTLKYYTVNVESGYYDGLQFTVDSEYDFDPESPWCIDNYDARDEWGECRSKVLRKAKSELNRIRRWLLSLKKDGYTELGCSGVFSSGEAVYTVIS